MKVSLKKIIPIVLAGAAALASMTASADVAAPTSGNGELTLFARDNVTGVVYARGLGIFLNDVLTEATSGGAYTGPTPISFGITTPIGPDANMSAFLTGANGHEIVWGLQTADTVGSNIAGTPRRIAFTTSADIVATSSTPSNSTLSGAAAAINGLFQSLNGNLPDAPGSSVFGSADAGGLWGNAGTAGGASQTVAGIITSGLIGSALNFYLVTSSGTTATGGNGLVGRVFQGLGITLSANGTLSSPSAPVPLPAAVWLLGSGLVGLAGIGRRRRKGAAAAV
jgi:hypothetical protein